MLNSQIYFFFHMNNSMCLQYATELFCVRKWSVIFHPSKVCPSGKMFWFLKQSVKMFCSILGSSCTGFPSATQTQTYIRRELETILRIMCNLVDSHFVLISRLFGTAHVLDEYAVIYIASDFTKLHRSSQHSTSIQDHIMTLCLETGINCTSARKYER